MVTKYGMSKELGTIAYGENEEEVFLGRSVTKQQNMSEETAKKVDAEVKKIVDKGYERARKILTEKTDDLHKLAKALLVYETLSGDEMKLRAGKLTNTISTVEKEPSLSMNDDQYSLWLWFAILAGSLLTIEMIWSRPHPGMEQKERVSHA